MRYLETDIFNVPILNRKAELAILQGVVTPTLVRKAKPIFPITFLAPLVDCGFLSANTALCFLLNRNVSQVHINYLARFQELWISSCALGVPDRLHVKALFDLWLARTKDVVPENTFRFPLAELVCSFDLDFTEERESYALSQTH